MVMESEKKRTPLYQYHIDQGANMGDFGGYEMPLWYKTGPKKEHLTVIQQAGMFDTSHMAGIKVSGPEAYDLLQFCFSKDLGACIGPKKLPLQAGKCVYGVFLNQSGHVIDDSLIYQIADQLYLLIVNAGMGGPISKHLEENIQSRNVTVQDLTDQLGKIDVQGPAAAKVVAKIIQNPDLIFDKLPYFNFKGFFDPSVEISNEVKLHNDAPILLSRTGYTGEFGFELFVEGKHTEYLWNHLLDAGNEFEVLTCGLAARDSLRAGALLPLSHQDIGGWIFLNHPWPFALAYDDSQQGFLKDFIGAQALLDANPKETTYAFAGYDPRKVIPGKETAVLDANDNIIGEVLTCATDMAIDRHEGKIVSIASPDLPQGFKFRGLSCGFVKVTTKLNPGDKVYLQGNNRKFEVEIRDDVRPDRTARKALAKML